MFNNRSRGNAITIFAMAVFCGPFFAPFIGGFIVTSDLGWRWTEYLTYVSQYPTFSSPTRNPPNT